MSRYQETDEPLFQMNTPPRTEFVPAVEALCRQWDIWTKGPSPTTKAVREAFAVDLEFMMLGDCL